MTSIGPQLKAARERSGMTATEAAARLHMRAMFVEAIERDDWRTVGEPVYVRGFIKNYARMVGIDAQPLVSEFNESVSASGETPAPVVRSFAARDVSRYRYPWLLGSMSVIALVLVIKVIWTIVTPTAADHSEVGPPPAAAMAPAADTHTAGSAVAQTAAAQHGVDLRLTLTQPCWLSITVDGKRVVYETLPAGTIKEFHGIRQISLRAGNAGGVVATIDGQALGTLGGVGQVQDRVFAVNTAALGQPGVHE